MWIPSAPPDAPNPFASDDLTPLPSDLYMCIDDIDESHARLVWAPWPSVSDDGHLSFPPIRDQMGRFTDDPTDAEAYVGAADLHEQVSADRARHSQLGPSRPLRVGDVFWFRGDLVSEGGGSDRLEGVFVDITYAAREEAKAAQVWATGAEVSDWVADEPTEPPAEKAAYAQNISDIAPAMPGTVASPSI